MVPLSASSNLPGFLLAARARKRAFIIAEKLALHEVAAVPAVHHDERRVGPPAPDVVDGLREKFLPVPLSPRMRVVTSLWAAMRAMRTTSCVAGALPTM